MNLIASTEGFQSSRAVALFPENFVTPIPPTRSNPVYYFINKFIDRFRTITIPFLTSGRVNLQPFENLLELSDAELKVIASVWVHMHEHFHTTGVLPVSEHFAIKSSRSSAAFEELRVDLLTILASFAEHRTEMGQLFKGVTQFVIAERLIRYPIESHPEKDYDARSSIVLATLLAREGALETDSNRLIIHFDRLEESIRSIANDIGKLELSISNLEPAAQKTSLVTFVKQHSLFTGCGLFQNLPVFEGAARYV